MFSDTKFHAGGLNIFTSECSYHVVIRHRMRSIMAAPPMNAPIRLCRIACLTSRTSLKHGEQLPTWVKAASSSGSRFAAAIFGTAPLSRTGRGLARWPTHAMKLHEWGTDTCASRPGRGRQGLNCLPPATLPDDEVVRIADSRIGDCV